jgi:hypothetical protein
VFGREDAHDSNQLCSYTLLIPARSPDRDRQFLAHACAVRGDYDYTTALRHLRSHFCRKHALGRAARFSRCGFIGVPYESSSNFRTERRVSLCFVCVLCVRVQKLLFSNCGHFSSDLIICTRHSCVATPTVPCSAFVHTYMSHCNFSAMIEPAVYRLARGSKMPIVHHHQHPQSYKSSPSPSTSSTTGFSLLLPFSFPFPLAGRPLPFAFPLIVSLSVRIT